MRILIDMNLSPDWVEVLRRSGFDAVHWSSVGDPRAQDRQIMAWALANGCILFTHDLDFGAILAATHASGPSVIQVRTQDTLPDAIGHLVIDALRQFGPQLDAGVIVVVDEARHRVRLLPIKGR